MGHEVAGDGWLRLGAKAIFDWLGNATAAFSSTEIEKAVEVAGESAWSVKDGSMFWKAFSCSRLGMFLDSVAEGAAADECQIIQGKRLMVMTDISTAVPVIRPRDQGDCGRRSHPWHSSFVGLCSPRKWSACWTKA